MLLTALSVAAAAPLNDAFAKRAAVGGLEAALYGSFAGASLEAGEPGPVFYETLWWTWTAPDHGLALITPPTNVSATVQVMVGNVFSNLAVVAQGSSAFSLTVTAGTTYTIRLGSDQPAQTAPFVSGLKLLPRPSNFSLSQPLPLAGTNVFIEATATPYTVWWEWTAPGIGYVTIDTTPSSRYANLFVYEYGSGGALQTFVTLSSFQTNVGGYVTAGKKLLISVAGGDTSGTNKLVLRIRMPAVEQRPFNDAFADALLLSGTNLSVTGLLTYATKENGEPDHGNNGVFQTVWYRWIAPGRGNVRLTLTSSSIDPNLPRLAVYRGNVLTNLTSLGLITGGLPWLPMNAGDEIVFAVADLFSSSFQLALRFWASPANDDCGFATPLSPGSQIALDTRGATKEAGEPNHAGSTSSRNTLWYTWTASGNGPVTLLSASTNADPVLAIYTGSALTNLIPITGTNDYRPLSTDSQVSFNAVAGQTYRIAAATRANTGGDCLLTFSTGTAPSITLTNTPANRTNVAGGSYQFELFPTDPEGGITDVTLNWGTNVYPVPGPPYLVTLSNLAPGNYNVFGGVQDADGHVAATRLTTFFISSTNDLADGRLPISSASLQFMSLAGGTQQAGEPFAASWWSWTPASNGVYLVVGDFSRVVVYEVSGTNFVLTAGRTNSNGARVAFNGKAGQEYALAVGGAVSGPPTGLLVTNGLANDFFTNPIVLPGTNGMISIPIVLATVQPGEPNHAALTMESSTWWTWTAPTNGTLFLETSSPITTRAVVYTGSVLSALTTVGARVTTPNSPSQWVAPVTAGQTYLIAVASQGNHSLNNLGATTTTRYAFYPRPANDSFSNALAVAGTVANGSGHNFSATSETDDPISPNSVWWKWIPPRSGAAHVVARGYYPSLVVCTGPALGSLSVISTTWTAGTNTEASFSFTTGTAYYLAFGGSPKEFAFTIDGASPANDAFSNRLALPSTGPRMTGDLLTASAEAGETYNPPVKSLWWTWTPTESGRVTIAKDFSYPANALVFTGTNLNQLTLVPSLTAGAYTFFAVAGTSYQIAIAAATGPYSLLVDASILPNEIPQVVILSPTNGQRFAIGEPIPVTIHAQDANGTITHINSGYFDATFSAPDVTWTYLLTNLPAGLGTVGASVTDNYGVLQNSAPVTIRVTSAHDDFETATLMSFGEIAAAGSNIGATQQTNEPPHTARGGGASVWWSWIAPSSGQWTVDTRNCNFDTALAVYSGNALTNLSLIGSNDDRRPGDTASAVTFTAISGATYRVAVDSADGRTGGIELHFTPSPMNDSFTNASTLAAVSATGGTTFGATAELSEPPHGGNAASHSTWWSWSAPASGNYFVSTAGSDFDTTLGVYAGTNFASLSLVAGNDDDGSYFTSRVSFQAVAGQKYWFAVDGYAGDAGRTQLILGWADALHLSSMLRSNQFQLTVIGWPGEGFEIQQSTNLTNWTLIYTQASHNGWLELPWSATNAPYLFYRARKP